MIVVDDVVRVLGAKKLQVAHPALWAIVRAGQDCLAQEDRDYEDSDKRRSEKERHTLQLEIREERIQALHAAILVLGAASELEPGALEPATAVQIVERPDVRHS